MSNRSFWQITLADFIARAAYQMGKTPLLPLFAAALGASDIYLGLIVSVSTLTGMAAKPFVGLLSDHAGRKRWLIIGTAFFTFVPFFYWFVHTPTQLFAIRIVHGMATAIYGPVTIAYVAEQQRTHTAERLAWFGWARSGGYVVGPAIAGWLLYWWEPAAIFTLIGLLSCIAFWPILHLPETVSATPKQPPSFNKQYWRQLSISGWRIPAIWLAGGLEAAVFIALYAIKAFLPIYALTAGFSSLLVGLFFSLQEVIHLLFKPLGGRWGDKWGYKLLIVSGMLLIGLVLPLLPLANTTITLLALSILLGTGQALIFPSTVALIADQIDSDHLGLGFGLLGTLQNGERSLGRY